jgi:hypothetical protein
MRILLMAARQEPNVLFCMPNGTMCNLLVSVMGGAEFFLGGLVRLRARDAMRWIHLTFQLSLVLHEHSEISFLAA